jgi:hypothetical protein
MIAKFVMHPVDTIKSKVQVNRTQLKYVTDYKPGMAVNLSISLIISELSKHGGDRELLDFLEV